LIIFLTHFPSSNVLFSGSLLQRQKWIVNYYVKKLVKESQ
jgi:hypothetical protein